LFATAGHYPPAENLGSPTPFLFFCQVTSSRRQFLSIHSALPFVIEFCFLIVYGQQKTLLPSGKQGLEILLFLYLLTFNLSKLASFTFDAKDSPGPNASGRVGEL